MSGDKQRAIDTLKSLAKNIAEEYGSDIEIEINVSREKGIVKVKIKEYCN